MLIFPAIDLRGGRVVRLSMGDYAQMTVYPGEPAQVAREFRAAGATHLHVVDLDGAKDGSQQNLSAIASVLREGGLFVEVGGGARDEDSVRRYLDLGVNRVILGTLAVENPGLTADLAARYPGRIAAGVDAKEGRVAIHGWRQVTDLDAETFLRALPDKGIDTVIYTDIARDGMLAGPNLEAYRRAAAIEGLNLVASGGVSSYDDLRALREMNLYAAIIGKALYAGRVDLARAIALAGGDEA